MVSISDVGEDDRGQGEGADHDAQAGDALGETQAGGHDDAGDNDDQLLNTRALAITASDPIRWCQSMPCCHLSPPHHTRMLIHTTHNYSNTEQLIYKYKIYNIKQYFFCKMFIY